MGETNLSCNDPLLERLQDAQELLISTSKLVADWKIKLLSSSANLKTLVLRWTPVDDAEMVDDIPEMNLPNLEELVLTTPPKSRITGDASLFFKELKTLRLSLLQVMSVNPKDLSSIKVDCTPKILVLEGLQIEAPIHGKAAASTLVHSIQDWKGLRVIAFRLPDTTPSTFYEHLFQLLTLLSEPNIQSRWRDKVLLQRLCNFQLQRGLSLSNPSVINGTTLASMIAARRACSSNQSVREVASAAVGLLKPSNAALSNEPPAFEPAESCVKISSLLSELAVETNNDVTSWLKGNVTALEVEKWVLSESE